MKSIRYYLKKAQKEKFAIPQFNFSDFNQMKAIVAAAKKLKSPIILGTSEGESKFFGMKEAVALRNVARKETNLPIFVNLDHGKSFEYLKQAIDAGYDMVHFDGSKLPLEENIKITKQVARYANWRGATAEGEVGRLGTDSSKLYTDKFEINLADLTNPDQAKEFVGRTGVDLLAISIGNFHGMEAAGTSPSLKIDLLKSIKDKTGRAAFVLHGGSGTPEDDIKKAIEMGVVKININTELRVAFTQSVRNFLEANKEEVVPYKFMPDAMNAVQSVAEKKITLFGSVNQA